MWRDTDAVHSWSWPGCQGKNAQIEIYSIGTEVELFQNGESLGRKKLEFCKASYETIYQMGRLKAVSYDEKGKLSAGAQEVRMEVCKDKIERLRVDVKFLTVFTIVQRKKDACFRDELHLFWDELYYSCGSKISVVKAPSSLLRLR